MNISIIGRPNVGKSSLFNRLMRSAHKIITYDTPGVTRDRHYGICHFDELAEQPAVDAVLVDTGGFYPEKVEDDNKLDKFLNIMAEHAKIAIGESDLVLLVVDVREGVVPFDRQIADYIRTQHKKMFLLVNKFDSSKQRGTEAEFFSLGVEELFPVSAAHDFGITHLRERLQKEILAQNDDKKKLQDGVAPRGDVVASIALIGAPNVGKSTLLNQLLGSTRALVSDIPGTTVDPIEGYFDLYFGKEVGLLKSGDENNYWRSIRIVDTAGIRRKKQISNFVESQSVFRSLNAINEADIVVYLADACKGIGHQDRRLLDIALEKGKSLIVCLNKVDLVKNKSKEWLQDMRDEIPWLSFCDLIPISAKFNQHINGLKTALKKTVLVRHKEISTSALNSCVRELVERNPVIIKGGGSRPLKIKYVSMVKRNPPTFIMFSNRAHGVPENYRRYLQNNLRESFGLYNTPVHLIFRTGREE